MRVLCFNHFLSRKMGQTNGFLCPDPIDPLKSKPRYSSRFSPVLRTISLVLVITFLAQDILFAQGGTPTWTSVTRTQEETGRGDSQLNQYSIPPDAGLTRKVSVNGKPGVIFNIQDAHSKLGAQESISKILDNLVKNYSLKLIALEGASDLVDTSLISSFPIDEVKKKTGEYLLKEGKIGAGEFFSMISKDDIKLMGVEDPSLYNENLQSFKAILDQKKDIRQELKNLKTTLNSLEEKVYSPKLYQMSQKKILHKNGDLKFTEYWDYFSKLSKEENVDILKYDNLKKLSSTIDLEKEIDFKLANKERDQLIEELGQKLPKPSLEKLILQALQYKQNKITPGVFHLYLSEVAQGQDLNPLTYKNIILYSQYVVLYESIDLIKIFEEIDSFETELKNKLFNSQDERTLSHLTHCVRILSQLLDTSLTSSDYAFFIQNQKDCEITSIQDTLKAFTAQYQVQDPTNFQVLEHSIPSAKKFYELAHKRNEVMLKNTLKRMKDQNTQVAALVTGGFHSEGISELMEEEKLSYLVVMPKFTGESPDRPYIAILTQKPKEYEEAFKDQDFYIAAWAPFSIIGTEQSLKDRELAIAIAVKETFKLTRTNTFSEEDLNTILTQYQINYDKNNQKSHLTPEAYKTLLKSAKGQRQGPEDFSLILGDKHYQFISDKSITVQDSKDVSLPSFEVPQAKVQELQALISKPQREFSVEEVATKLLNSQRNKASFTQDDAIRAARQSGFMEVNDEAVADIVKMANERVQKTASLAAPVVPASVGARLSEKVEIKETAVPAAEQKVPAQPVKKQTLFEKAYESRAPFIYTLVTVGLLPILAPFYNLVQFFIRGDEGAGKEGPAAALIHLDIRQVPQAGAEHEARLRQSPPETLIFSNQVYQNIAVPVEKGVAIETPTPQELILRRHPDRQPRHLFKEDERGYPIEPAGTGWGRRWVLITDRNDHFVSVNVYDGDRPIFNLSGNVTVNGEPIEKWAKKGLTLTLKDKIRYDLVTRFVFEDEKQKTAATGSITSSARSKDGFSYAQINPSAKDADRRDSAWTGDVEQRINRGKTADGKYIVSEVRSYLKNKNGEILFVDQKPRYYARYEYFDEAENLRFTVSGYHDEQRRFVGNLLSVVHLETAPARVQDRWKINSEDTYQLNPSVFMESEAGILLDPDTKRPLDRGVLPSPDRLLGLTDKLLSRSAIVGTTDHRTLVVNVLEAQLKIDRDKSALGDRSASRRRQEAILKAIQDIETILKTSVKPGQDSADLIRQRLQKLTAEEKAAADRSDALVKELEWLAKQQVERIVRERQKVILKREFLRDGVGKGRFLSKDVDVDGRHIPFTQSEMDEVEKNSGSSEAAALLSQALSNDALLYFEDQGFSAGSISISSYADKIRRIEKLIKEIEDRKLKASQEQAAALGKILQDLRRETRDTAKVSLDLRALEEGKRHILDRETHNVTGPVVSIAADGSPAVKSDDEKRPLRLESVIRPDHAKTTELSAKSPTAGYDLSDNTLTRDTRLEKVNGVRRTGAVGFKAYDPLGYLVSETFHNRYRTIVRRQPLSHQELGQVNFGYNPEASERKGEPVYNVPLSYSNADLAAPGNADVYLLYWAPLYDEKGRPKLDQDFKPVQFLFHKDDKPFTPEEMSIVMNVASSGPGAAAREALLADAKSASKSALYDRFGDLIKDRVGSIEVQELYDAAGFNRGSREWFKSADGKVRIILSEGRPAERKPNSVLVDKYVYQYVRGFLQSKTEKNPDGSPKLIDPQTLTDAELDSLPERVHAVRIRETRAPHGKLLTQVASGRFGIEGDVQVRVDYDASDRETGQRAYGKDEATGLYILPKSAGFSTTFDEKKGITEIRMEKYRYLEGDRYLSLLLKSEDGSFRYSRVSPVLRQDGKVYSLRADLLREDVLRAGKIYYETPDGSFFETTSLVDAGGREVKAEEIERALKIEVTSGLGRTGQLLYQIVNNVYVEVVYDEANRSVEYAAYAWDPKARSKIEYAPGKPVVLGRGQNLTVREDGILLTEGKTYLYVPKIENGRATWSPKLNEKGEHQFVPLREGYFGNGNLDVYFLGGLKTDVSYRGGFEDSRSAVIVSDSGDRSKSVGTMADLQSESLVSIRMNLFHYNNGRKLASHDIQYQTEDENGRQMGLEDRERGTKTVILRDPATGLKYGSQLYRNGRLFREARIVDFSPDGDEISEVTNLLYDETGNLLSRNFTRAVQRPEGDLKQETFNGITDVFYKGFESSTHLNTPSGLTAAESGKPLEKTVSFTFDPKTRMTTHRVASVFTGETSREVVRDERGMLVSIRVGSFLKRFDPDFESRTGIQRPLREGVLRIGEDGKTSLFEEVTWTLNPLDLTILQTNRRVDGSLEEQTLRHLDGTLISRTEKHWKVGREPKLLRHFRTEYNVEESRRLGFEVPTVTWNVLSGEDKKTERKKYSNARHDEAGRPTMNVWDSETDLTREIKNDHDGTTLSESWIDPYTGWRWITTVESMRDRYLKFRQKSHLSAVDPSGAEQRAADYIYREQYRVKLSEAKIEGIEKLMQDPVDVPAELKPFALSKISQGLREIAQSLGLDEVTLVKTEVTIAKGSTNYHYRVEEDPDARILIFRLGDDKSNFVVNTKWKGENAVEGYELSQTGKIFKLKSSETLTTDQVVLEKLGLNESVRDQLVLKKVMLGQDKNIALSEIQVYLLDDKHVNSAQDEVNAVLWRSGYVMQKDPLLRNFLSIQNSQYRLFKWFDTSTQAPFGISPGEIVVVGGEHQKVIRETTFSASWPDAKEYVYKVDQDLQNGRVVANPNFYLGFNYHTGVVWEHQRDENWKLYSKDGFPLVVMVLKGEEEYLHSRFITKRLVRGGQVYILTQEDVITATPTSPLKYRLVKDNEIVALQVGDIVYYDPFDVTYGDKFLSSIPGRFYQPIQSAVSGREDARALIREISRDGERINLNNVHLLAGKDVYVDWVDRALLLIDPRHDPVESAFFYAFIIFTLGAMSYSEKPRRALKRFIREYKTRAIASQSVPQAPEGPAPEGGTPAPAGARLASGSSRDEQMAEASRASARRIYGFTAAFAAAFFLAPAFQSGLQAANISSITAPLGSIVTNPFAMFIGLSTMAVVMLLPALITGLLGEVLSLARGVPVAIRALRGIEISKEDRGQYKNIFFFAGLSLAAVAGFSVLVSLPWIVYPVAAVMGAIIGYFAPVDEPEEAKTPSIFASIPWSDVGARVLNTAVFASVVAMFVGLFAYWISGPVWLIGLGAVIGGVIGLFAPVEEDTSDVIEKTVLFKWAAITAVFVGSFLGGFQGMKPSKEKLEAPATVYTAPTFEESLQKALTEQKASEETSQKRLDALKTELTRTRQAIVAPKETIAGVEARIGEMEKRHSAIRDEIDALSAQHVLRAGLLDGQKPVTLEDKRAMIHVMGLSRYLGYLEFNRDQSYRRRMDERISMPASAPYGVITHTMDRPLYYLYTRVLTEEDLGNLNLSNLRSLSEEQIKSAGVDYLYSDKQNRVYLHSSGTGAFPAYSGLVDIHLGNDPATGKVIVQQVQLKHAGWQKAIDLWIEKQAAKAVQNPLVQAAVERGRRINELEREDDQLNAEREKARVEWRGVKNTLAALEASEKETAQDVQALESRLEASKTFYEDLRSAPRHNPYLIGKYTALLRQRAQEIGVEAQVEPVLDALSRLKTDLEDQKKAASAADLAVLERIEALEEQYFAAREEEKENGRRIADFQAWLDAKGIVLPQAPSKLAASIAAGQKIEVPSTIPFVYPESKIVVPADQLVSDPAVNQYLKDQQFKQVSAEFGYVREHSHGFSRVKYFTRDKEGRWLRIKEDFLPNYTLTIREGLRPARYFKFDQARKEFVEVSGESLLDYMAKNNKGGFFQVSLWQGRYLTLDQIEQMRRDWAEGKSVSEGVNFDQLYEAELRNFYQKNAVPGRWLKAKTPEGGVIMTWVPEDQITIFDVQKEDTIQAEQAKVRRNQDQGYVVRTSRGLEWRAVPEAALKKPEAPKEGYWLILPGGSPFFVEKNDYQRLRAQAKNNAGVVTLKFENKALQIRLDETKPNFVRFGSFGFTVIEPSEAAVKRAGLILPNYAPIPDEMVLPRHLALPHRPALVNPQFNIEDFQEFLTQNVELFREYQTRFNRQDSVDADLNQEIFNRLRQREPELRQKYAEFTRMYDELVKKFGYPANTFPATMPVLTKPEEMHPGHAYAAIMMDNLDPGAQWLIESALALYIRRLDPSIQTVPWQLLTATKNIRSVGVMRENWQKVHAFESWYEYYSFPNIFVERPDVRKSPYLGDRVIPGYGPYIPAEHALLSHIGLRAKEIEPSEFTVGLKMTGLAGRLEDQKRDEVDAAALRYLQLSIVPGIEARKPAAGVIVAIESMQSEAESEINRLRRLKVFGPREALQLKKAEEFLSYLKDIADPANPARNDARDAAGLSDEELKELRYDLARAELQLQRLHSAGLLEAADGTLKPLTDYNYNRVIRPYSHLSEAERKLLPKALHQQMAVEPDQFFFQRVENKKNVYDRLHFGVDGLHRYLTDTVKTKAADFRDGVPASDVYEANDEFKRLTAKIEILQKETRYFQDAQLNLARRIRGAEFARYLKTTYGFDARALSPAVVKKEKEDIFKRATPQGFNAKLISEREEKLVMRDKALSDLEKLKKKLETKQRLSYHIIDDSTWDPYGPRKFYAIVLDEDRKVVEYIIDPSDVPADAFMALESAENQWSFDLPNGHKIVKTANAAIVDKKTGQATALLDGVNFPAELVGTYLPDRAVRERIHDRYLVHDNYPVMAAKVKITKAEHDRLKKSLGAMAYQRLANNIFFNGRGSMPTVRGVEEEKGVYYAWYYGTDFTKIPGVESVHPLKLDKDRGNIEISGLAFSADKDREIVFGENTARQSRFSEEFDKESIQKLWGLVNKYDGHRDEVFDLIVGIKAGLEQAEEKIAQGRSVLDLATVAPSERVVIERILNATGRPGQQVNPWEVKIKLEKALLQAVKLALAKGRPEWKLRTVLVRQPEDIRLIENAKKELTMLQEGGAWVAADEAIHPAVDALYGLHAETDMDVIRKKSNALQSVQAAIQAQLLATRPGTPEHARLTRILDESRNYMSDRGVLLDPRLGVPRFARVYGVQEAKRMIARINTLLNEIESEIAQTEIEDTKKKLPELKKRLDGLKRELDIESRKLPSVKLSGARLAGMKSEGRGDVDFVQRSLLRLFETGRFRYVNDRGSITDTKDLERVSGKKESADYIVEYLFNAWRAYTIHPAFSDSYDAKSGLIKGLEYEIFTQASESGTDGTIMIESVRTPVGARLAAQRDYATGTMSQKLEAYEQWKRNVSRLKADIEKFKSEVYLYLKGGKKKQADGMVRDVTGIFYENEVIRDPSRFTAENNDKILIRSKELESMRERVVYNGRRLFERGAVTKEELSEVERNSAYQTEISFGRVSWPAENLIDTIAAELAEYKEMLAKKADETKAKEALKPALKRTVKKESAVEATIKAPFRFFVRLVTADLGAPKFVQKYFDFTAVSFISPLYGFIGVVLLSIVSVVPLTWPAVAVGAAISTPAGMYMAGKYFIPADETSREKAPQTQIRETPKTTVETTAPEVKKADVKSVSPKHEVTVDSNGILITLLTPITILQRKTVKNSTGGFKTVQVRKPVRRIRLNDPLDLLKDGFPIPFTPTVASQVKMKDGKTGEYFRGPEVAVQLAPDGTLKIRNKSNNEFIFKLTPEQIGEFKALKNKAVQSGYVKHTEFEVDDDILAEFGVKEGARLAAPVVTLAIIRPEISESAALDSILDSLGKDRFNIVYFDARTTTKAQAIESAQGPLVVLDETSFNNTADTKLALVQFLNKIDQDSFVVLNPFIQRLLSGGAGNLTREELKPILSRINRVLPRIQKGEVLVTTQGAFLTFGTVTVQNSPQGILEGLDKIIFEQVIGQDKTEDINDFTQGFIGYLARTGSANQISSTRSTTQSLRLSQVDPSFNEAPVMPLTQAPEDQKTIVTQWSVFSKDAQGVPMSLRIRNLNQKAPGHFKHVLLVDDQAILNQYQGLSEEERLKAFQEDHPHTDVFDKQILFSSTIQSLEDLQKNYSQLGQKMVLIADEDKNITQGTPDKTEGKLALLVNLSRDSENNIGILEFAAGFISNPDQEPPSYVKKLADGTLIYLKRLTPIEYQKVITEISRALAQVGAAA